MTERLNNNQLNELLVLCRSRNAMINTLTAYQKDLHDCLKIVNKKIYCFGPIWCFVWRIVLLILLAIGLVYFGSIDIVTSRNIWYYIAPIFMALGLTAFIVILIFTIIKTITAPIHHFKAKQAKKKIEELEPKSNELIMQIDTLSDRIKGYDYLPEIYWYAGDIIISYIFNKRADNLKEAINLFEYERRMDIQFNKQMAMLEQINNEIKNNRRSNSMGNAILTGAVIASGFIARR